MRTPKVYQRAISAALIWYTICCSARTIPHYGPALRTTPTDRHVDNVPSTYKPHLLQKRMDLDVLYFDHTHSLWPIEKAAALLEVFYTHVALNSGGEWGKNEPRVWIRITLGCLQLVMTATEGYTVPWGFVTYFALQMLTLTERGFVGAYNAYYVTPDGGGGILVSLVLRTIGPLTPADWQTSVSSAVSSLNAHAQSWFPARGAPA